MSRLTYHVGYRQQRRGNAVSHSGQKQRKGKEYAACAGQTLHAWRWTATWDFEMTHDVWDSFDAAMPAEMTGPCQEPRPQLDDSRSAAQHGCAIEEEQHDCEPALLVLLIRGPKDGRLDENSLGRKLFKPRLRIPLTQIGTTSLPTSCSTVLSYAGGPRQNCLSPKHSRRVAEESATYPTTATAANLHLITKLVFTWNSV